MSTVFVDTIKNQTGTTSLAANKLPDMLSGSSKCWSNIDGTGTVNLRDSFNVSTLTDSGTGHYTLSFSSSMSSSNYSPVVSGNIAIGNSGRDVSCPATTNSSSQVGMKCFRSDNLTAEDFDFVMAQIDGNLA